MLRLASWKVAAQPLRLAFRKMAVQPTSGSVTAYLRSEVDSVRTQSKKMERMSSIYWHATAPLVVGLSFGVYYYRRKGEKFGDRIKALNQTLQKAEEEKTEGEKKPQEESEKPEGESEKKPEGESEKESEKKPEGESEKKSEGEKKPEKTQN